MLNSCFFHPFAVLTSMGMAWSKRMRRASIFWGAAPANKTRSEHVCVKSIMFNFPQDFPGKANNLEAPPAEEIRSTAATQTTSLIATCSSATMEFGLMRLRSCFSMFLLPGLWFAGSNTGESVYFPSLSVPWLLALPMLSFAALPRAQVQSQGLSKTWNPLCSPKAYEPRIQASNCAVSLRFPHWLAFVNFCCKWFFPFFPKRC